MMVIYIPFNKKILRNIIVMATILLLLTFIYINPNNYMGVFNMASPNPIYKGNEKLPRVAFACNVVWGTEYVPQMLDIFKDKQVNITFFIGGEWAKDNPELLNRILQEGHEIGNHGYSHRHHNQLNIDQNIKEIKATEEVIEEILGLRTTLFAPPYGEFNDTTLQAAGSLGYKTIMWSIDTIDWRREGADIILRRVLKNPNNGDFILMHPVDDTVKALPTMVDELKRKGLEVGTISNLLD